MARIVVLGAGTMGLAAAYQALKDGHQVDVLEAAPEAGQRPVAEVADRPGQGEQPQGAVHPQPGEQGARTHRRSIAGIGQELVKIGSGLV